MLDQRHPRFKMWEPLPSRMHCVSVDTTDRRFWVACATPCTALTARAILLNIVQSNGWIMVSCFPCHFSDYQWTWTSFHVFIGHFYFFFPEEFARILGLFFCKAVCLFPTDLRNLFLSTNTLFLFWIPSTTLWLSFNHDYTFFRHITVFNFYVHKFINLFI